MRKNRRNSVSPQGTKAAFAHNPFRRLKEIAKQRPPAPTGKSGPTTTIAEPPSTPAEADPGDLFLRAVAGTQPLEHRQRQRVEHPMPASPAREMSDPDAEVLAELCDLVSGDAPFDIEQSDEYIEGAVVGLDGRVLRRLKAGEFAYQGYVDLHGMNTEEARATVETFLRRAYQQGKRCVLIVHGRGLNSKDQTPVLKARLVGWLSRGQWARWVLAFATARPVDGGAGALYVLLRRKRHVRQPIRVTNGAKW